MTSIEQIEAIDRMGDELFFSSFSYIQDDVHRNAVSKGFWDEDGSDGEKIALMHAELSEALEALREGNPESIKIPGFSHVEEELGDTVIRIMDYAAKRGLNVAGAIIAKKKYNSTRPHKHGKEF